MDYEKIENKEFLDEINRLTTENYKLKMESKDESLLLSILNSLPDNVVMVDNNLKIMWANNIAMKNNSVSIGSHCYCEYQKNDIPCKDCPCVLAIKSGNIEKSVVKLNLEEDVEKYWEVYGIPLKDDSQNVTGVVEVSRDVTDRVMSEQKLKENSEAIQKAKNEAEVANRAKTNFLANTSHEIRTPMNGIMGMVQLLKTTKLVGSQKEYVEILEESTKRLSEIINNILEISKIEDGKLELTKNIMSIRSMLNDIYSFYNIQAKNNNIKFFLEVEDSIPHKLIGDSYRINQMILNIVDNSFKFTKSGYVKIKVSELSRSDKNCNLRITVEDSGIGVPDSKKEYIFERFNQVDSSLTREYGGTGLGLAISKQLVELMGGAITLESKTNIGTTINMDLKLAYVQAKPEEKHEIDSGEAESNKDKKILIVEDEIVGRVTLKLMLRDKYTIIFAKNGKEGVDMFARHNPDLVLMDIMMPVMNGFEAFDKIERINTTNVPIIACTAKVIDTEKKYLVSYGFDDYLSKPIDMGILNSILRKYLG